MVPESRRSGRGNTVDQLRRAIDNGLTGDKVRGTDMAAVPLGTDEEAAGTPISVHDVARCLDEQMTLRTPQSARAGPTSVRVPIAVFALLALAVAGWAMMS